MFLQVVAALACFSAVQGRLILREREVNETIKTSGAQEPAAPEKVRLEIFYETQCPFSLSLIANGLREVWRDPELRDRIDLHLYPAGNTQVVPTKNVSGGYRFWHEEMEEPGHDYVFLCQHGESECLGNLIQACAMEELKEPNAYLPLIFCMSALPQYAVEKSSYECASHLNISMAPIRECVKSPKGNAAMHAIAMHGNSLTPSRTHVPWVSMNGQHEFLGDSGDVQGPLCSILKNQTNQTGIPAPAACTDATTGNDPSAAFEAAAKLFGGDASKPVPHFSESPPSPVAAAQMSSAIHKQKAGELDPRFCYAPDFGATSL